MCSIISHVFAIVKTSLIHEFKILLVLFSYIIAAIDGLYSFYDSKVYEQIICAEYPLFSPEIIQAEHFERIVRSVYSGVTDKYGPSILKI